MKAKTKLTDSSQDIMTLCSSHKQVKTKIYLKYSIP